MVVFQNLLAPVATNVQAKWGVPAPVLLAQAALETGWGKHVVGNAYFGIKGKSASGGTTNFTTHENIGGKKIKITDNFRAYKDLAEAADDYGQFLRNNKRYAAAFAYTNNPEEFVHQIAKAGYATDPNYATKLIGIMRSHPFKKP